MKIGILALQGAFRSHVPHIEALGADPVFVVRKGHLEGLDGLILPGGESSTMLNLIQTAGLKEYLLKAIFQYPVWGICAGAILLAKTVESPAQESFGRLNMTVQRNGYGSQLDSRETLVDGYTVRYIRAPIISAVDSSLEVLAQREGNPTWVRTCDEHPGAMATTFHPELTLDYPSPMHQVFFNMLTQ